MSHALALNDPPDKPRTLMSPNKAGRDAARQALTARMAEKGFDNPRQLAIKAGVHPNSIYDLFRGRQWPRQSTRTKIEVALGWKIGELARIATAADELAIRRASRQELHRRRARSTAAGGPKVMETKLIRPDGPHDPRAELSRSTPLDEGIVLDFAPGALEGLTPAEAREVRTAALLAALERMRQIRELKRDEHRSGTDAAGDHPGG